MLENFVQVVIARRRWVLLLSFILTALAIVFATQLRIVILPASLLPQSHPFVASKAILENVFGEKYTFIVAVTPKSEKVADDVVIGKIQRLTEGLRQQPGLVKSSLLSITSENAKAIIGNSDGFEVRPFNTVLAQSDKLLSWLTANPIYTKTLVSEDRRLFAVIAQFQPNEQGFRAILNRMQPIIDLERDEFVDVYVGGHVNFLGEIERYSERMVVLVPMAIVVIALLLYGAFRSFQGMFLPLLTAILALTWVLGIMGASGIPLDAFNATTPILILAIAAGHAVQILKRYYEEYARLCITNTDMSPRQANEAAVVASVSKVGRYMIAASLVAAMGFLSLTVFEIKTVKTFGIFTGLGILCALLIELTFMPALRSWLKPPSYANSVSSTVGALDWLIRQIISVARTRKPFVLWLVVLVFAVLGALQVKVENSNKGNFSEWTQVRQDDAAINRQLAGTQTFYVIVDTGQDNGIKQPAVLNGLEVLQRELEKNPDVGKTLSIGDFLKRMNQAMHEDKVEANSLPDTAELAGQYLLLYSLAGNPDDLKSFVDFNYRRANLKVFVRRDDSTFILDLVEKTRQLATNAFPAEVKVSFAGGVADVTALNEVLVRDKLLNIAQIVLVVFIASSLIFRSSIAGILVLLPLLIAVAVNFGMLGWLGIPLNIPTSLISAMSVGIGADYAIYIISRYREELRKDAAFALENTLNSAGKACMYVATAVAFGYGVLALSFGFKVHQWLALLIATAMFVSVLAALSLVPALLERYRPKFLDK
jgi:predicted RND superfamily exporter protein